MRRAESLTARLLVLAALLAVLAGTLAGCGSGVPQVPSDAATNKPIDLANVEVREYKGKKLDSVADFRENSIAGPQKVEMNAYRLEVKGMVTKPQSLTYKQVIDRQSYEKVVRLNCVEGWSVDILWKGVKLSDILEQAGYDKRGKTVIFRCYDGYSTSLPLKTVIDKDLLLAYRMNGIDLPVERGYPFQVVAEDKFGYKWAKWVTSIEVSPRTDFKGYWESRGYDNDASYPGK
jgi:DMSO/TMAO reductase YedYZ molybdopterin-dependent catalytic subunit